MDDKYMSDRQKIEHPIRHLFIFLLSLSSVQWFCALRDGKR